MAGKDKKNDLLEKIKEQIDNLSELKPEDLSRKNDFKGELSFEETVPVFKYLLSQFQPLYTRDLSRLTPQELDRIQSSFNTVLNTAHRIQNFKLSPGQDPLRESREIIDTFITNKDSLVQQILLSLAVTAMQSIDIVEYEKKVQTSLDAIKCEESLLKATSTHALEQVAKSVKEVQKLAAESGVSANAKAFMDESIIHKDLASGWLNLTYVFAGVTIIIAFGFFGLVFQYTPDSTAGAIQYVFAKLILLSTLMFTLILCSKNYMAHKHNETLNSHRANALRTFQAFYEGTSNPEVKDTILLQAASAAFTNRSTGYESAPEKEGQSSPQVIDIVSKSVGPIAKASQSGPVTQ